MLENKIIRDSIFTLHDLGSNICNNMLELGLSVDDWDKINRYLHDIEDILNDK